jgi:hypothetical protein
MRRHTTILALPDTSHSRHIILLAGAIGILLLLWTVAARAADQVVPWECSGYTGDAQARCVNTFVELQREEIAKLKGQLQAQEGAVNQLRQQADRQAAAAADAQRQLSSPPTVVPATPYVYSYVYPPAVGLGLYIGRPWIYGPPYFYRPYWGPHFHGHWRH